MTAKLRIPFFALALLIMVVIVALEAGAVTATQVAGRLPPFLRGGQPGAPLARAIQAFTPEQQAELDRLRSEKAGEIAGLPEDIEGFAIPYLRLLDVILLFTLALMALGILIPDYVQGKIQGCITVIFVILLILAAIVAIFVALAKLMVMVSLLLSFPFGTLAYLIIYGSFPRGASNAVLSLLFMLKFAFVIVLLLAHQRFVENKGLVIFIIASFVANIIIGFLYGLVPGFLVSITDAIAAIVVGIIAIILALILGIGALFSVVLALKPL